MPLLNAKIFPLPLTPLQKGVLDTLAPRGKQADYLRALIAADCERRGISWPADLVTRGKYKRKQNTP